MYADIYFWKRDKIIEKGSLCANCKGANNDILNNDYRGWQ
jgi:hypothetical protein